MYVGKVRSSKCHSCRSPEFIIKKKISGFFGTFMWENVINENIETNVNVSLPIPQQMVESSPVFKTMFKLNIVLNVFEYFT